MTKVDEGTSLSQVVKQQYGSESRIISTTPVVQPRTNQFVAFDANVNFIVDSSIAIGSDSDVFLDSRAQDPMKLRITASTDGDACLIA